MLPLLLPLLCFWTVLVLLYGGGGPDAVRWGAVVLVLSGLGLAWSKGVGASATVTAAVAVTGVYLFAVQPRHDRDWTEDQSRLPDVHWEGDRFTITDFRRFRYRAVDDWDARWTTETFDLNDLVGADMGIEQFASLEAVAHTFVSFRFADGRVLAASVEIRKENGESFSPLKGMFRQYEKMVVLGDERDLVELRAVHREDEVTLHPLHISRERVVDFLRSLLDETAAIHEAPVFYHTVLASCSSSLAVHIRAVEPLGWDLRMFLPGYADVLAHELGWLGPGELSELRQAHRVDATAAGGREDFSILIRQVR